MHKCSHASQHHSIFCIIPPYILEQIAENGTAEQVAFAQQTLDASHMFRQERQAVARGEVPAGPVAMGLPEKAAAAGKQRFVYTANNGSTLPGVLVRQEGQPPSTDVAVNEAYDGSGYTYDLYSSVYGRNSIDNNGMSLISTVHYQRNYDNAFWDGHQMVYGDGDEGLPPAQQIFNRFTIALDVIGHELTHGVTQNEANLTYSNQPGALNESISDVFGSLVKQYRNNETARAADWIIGEGLFTPNIHGVGIRSMKAPGTAYDDPLLGKDPQPANMSNYVTTSQDNGGVHINSGIPNHAFYVAAYELDGPAWEKAGVVWYAALTDGRLSSTASFNDFANLTFQVAGEKFGSGSQEQQAVKKGWTEVGINVVDPGGTTGSSGCSLASLLQIFNPRSGSGR